MIYEKYLLRIVNNSFSKEEGYYNLLIRTRIRLKALLVHMWMLSINCYRLSIFVRISAICSPNNLLSNYNQKYLKIYSIISLKKLPLFHGCLQSHQKDLPITIAYKSYLVNLRPSSKVDSFKAHLPSNKLLQQFGPYVRTPTILPSTIHPLLTQITNKPVHFGKTSNTTSNKTLTNLNLHLNNYNQSAVSYGHITTIEL